MKVRSLKQVLHWAFLVVGAASLLFLAFSVSTYLDYARDGYGLKASIADSWLNEGKLVLKLRVENPGGMDLYLGNVSGVQGKLTLNEAYPVHFQQTRVRAGNLTTVIISIDISVADMESIMTNGNADMLLEIVVIAPERDLRTGIAIEAKGMEVRA